MARPLQLALPAPRTWGGHRPGAGRPPTPGRRPGVAHRPRPPHIASHPVHVTLRAGPSVRCLRAARVFPVVRAALALASGAAFRVLHFSVQDDHVHLIVEADVARAFARGLRGLAIRIARAVNRALSRRGTVWGDRYHARALTTPRAVRHALVYVLMNRHKHHGGEATLDRARRRHGSTAGVSRSAPSRVRRRWSLRGPGLPPSDGAGTACSDSTSARAEDRGDVRPATRPIRADNELTD